ncbi:hypothetical protein TSAR_011317 [Trichomalopsis sarcophagae]|uniref:Uncharacterized protein n=1 Tax=Trichomalopsis sarcophagae TaxID=543379 RepID=A0A232EMN5_9HYME|nr:hypothetical protein TSAR_011317 [Trichomalopsis sarcophagae]
MGSGDYCYYVLESAITSFINMYITKE